MPNPYTVTFGSEPTIGWTVVKRKLKREFQSPQREAAMFFGMFLRGQPVESLRAQIDVPPKVFIKWMKLPEFDPDFRDHLRRTYVYRKQVLWIFDSLVTSSQSSTPSQ